MAGSPSPETAKHRARLAGITATRGADDPEIPVAKRDLEASKLADHIKRVLAQAPPLTGEQRSKLAELLKPVRVTPSDLPPPVPPPRMPPPHIPAAIRKGVLSPD